MLLPITELFLISGSKTPSSGQKLKATIC